MKIDIGKATCVILMDDCYSYSWHSINFSRYFLLNTQHSCILNVLVYNDEEAISTILKKQYNKRLGM